MQELWRCNTRTGNASSAAVALLTELQERASTTRCAGSYNPQKLLPSLHWLTITMKKHQDQNGSRANSRTSTSTTTYQLRTTGRLDHYRNRRLQETAGEKSTAKWKITTLTRWVSAPFPPTIGIWAGMKSSTVPRDYIPFSLSVY
jgi:hypothetical protein